MAGEEGGVNVAHAVQAVTEAQVAHYREKGWVHLPALLSEHVAALSASIDAQMASMVSDAWDGPWHDKFENGANFTLLTKHGIHDEDATWHQALTSAPMLSAMEALLGGGPVKILQSTIIVKPPKDGQAFPPHQDSAYYGKKGEESVVALVHLDDTVPENGPIRYLDGSHQGGVRPHTRAGKKYLVGIRLEDMSEVCASTGDVVCGNIHTVHGSMPNRSNQPRRLVRVVYRRQA